MKIVLLLSLFISVRVAAQEPCGTTATPDVLSSWNTRAQTLQSFANKGTQAYAVPVHIHIVGDDNGVGYFATANAYELVCELNQRYASLQISFFLDDSVTHIANSLYTNPSLPYASQMMNTYNRPRACNIYMVPGLTGLCGYAYFPNQGPSQGRGGILLKNGCSLPGNSDPTHEMGHYFSLLHTFQDWNTSNAEAVNGSNCAAKGDHFCDTRADWQDFRWSCPYTGNKRDFNNDGYMPDSSLYMGYSNAPCPSRFSPQQGQAIIYSRANDRPYLDSVAAPSYPPLTPANLLTPTDMDAAVPSSNFARFSWNRVAGATAYNLRIKLPATLFANSLLNVVTPDTFYIVNSLQPGATYEWRVQPLNYVATCITPDAIGIQTRSFSVVYANGVNTLPKGVQDAQLYPNPLMSGQDLNLKLSLLQRAALTISVVAMDGKVMHTQTVLADAGNSLIPIHTASLPDGIYALRVCADGFGFTRRFIQSSGR